MNCVRQDAREGKTKSSKTFTTYFFLVGDEIREIVADRVRYLREDKLWGNDDPLPDAGEIVDELFMRLRDAGVNMQDR